MSEKDITQIGTILWTDLTIDNAEEVSKFYSKVIGWKSEPVSMGDYNDFSMANPASDDPVAGVCHKRGDNADLPSQWLNYFSVDNLEQSIESCKQLGGKIIVEPKAMGEMGKYCIIEDPAGAVCALFETA